MLDIARTGPLVWRDPLVALDRLATSEGYEAHMDLAYGNAEFQKLDVAAQNAHIRSGGKLTD